MSYDTLFTALLSIFALLGILTLLDAIVRSFRIRWTRKFHAM
jgi:hypothetical protein